MILFFFERGSPCPRGRLHNRRLFQVLKNQLVFVWEEGGLFKVGYCQVHLLVSSDKREREELVYLVKW